MKPQKETFAAAQAAPEGEITSSILSTAPEGSLIAAVNKAGAVTNTRTETNNIKSTIDPKYLQMGSLVTENVLASIAFNEDVREQSQADVAIGEEVEELNVKGTPKVSKALQNAKLGQEIHREYMRWKNTQEGRPSDEYTDLSNTEATTLGDAFKELYYESNKGESGNKFMERSTDPATGQTYFNFTPLGLDLLKKGNQTRKRMFPKVNVRPLNNPSQTGHLLGEQGKYRKAASGIVGKPQGQRVLEESMRNLSSIPNVVDTQRLKILLSTLLPVLASGDINAFPEFANAYGIGPSVKAKFDAKEKSNLKEGKTDYKASDNLIQLQETVAQSLFSIAQERGKANYLTYYLQAFNGRVAPQQSLFDPTSSKVVRFVTRNATPA